MPPIETQSFSATVEALESSPYQSPVSQNNCKYDICNVLLPPPTTWTGGWILGGKKKRTEHAPQNKGTPEQGELFTTIYNQCVPC